MTIRKQGSTRTMNGFLTSTALAAVALAVLTPATASAQGTPDPQAPAASSNCPPGSWFCADAQQPAQPGLGAQPGQPLQPLPSPEAAKPALPPPGGFAPPPPSAAPPPPVVIYQPAPPIMVVQPRSDMPPRYNYTARPPAATWQRQREWGVNLHLIGAMMGKKAAGDASMGGFGLGLRYKTSPHFGLEAGVDHFDGRDYAGNTRDETAFSLNGLVFVNPKSRAQVYFVGGVNWSSAQVRLDYSAMDRTEYTYFGGQVGVGMELRAARHLAFNLDIKGFVRGRTDDLARYTPEFHDNNGRTTNMSGGGLLTAGMTFYF